MARTTDQLREEAAKARRAVRAAEQRERDAFVDEILSNYDGRNVSEKIEAARAALRPSYDRNSSVSVSHEKRGSVDQTGEVETRVSEQFAG